MGHILFYGIRTLNSQVAANADLPGLTQSMQPADQFGYEEEDMAPKAKAKAKPAARKRKESAPKKPANGTKARQEPAASDDDIIISFDTDEDEAADTDEDATPKKKRKPATETGGGPLLSPEMQAFLGVQRMNRFKVRHVGPVCDSVTFLPKAWLHGIEFRTSFCSRSDHTSTAAATLLL